MMSSKFKLFIKGIGSIINIFPEPLESQLKNTTDFDRIRRDWQNVGNDMNVALKGFKAHDRSKKSAEFSG